MNPALQLDLDSLDLDSLDLHSARVLDGGFASELEFQGCDIGGPLWSAHVLEDQPEKVVAVHRAYLEAGADCLLTASYQVTRRGYAELGLGPERADAALRKAVRLAAEARRQFPQRRVLLAASLGPYGAALHNGSEYHGNYDCSFAELVQFHQERIAVLGELWSDTGKGQAATGHWERPDLLAFETLPSLEEARAIVAALAPWPGLPVWLSFTCRDGLRVAHGERLQACAEVAASLPQTVAIGVNCTHPGYISSLIGELRSASSKTIVVYPNSGEGWDAETRLWTGSPARSGDAAAYGEMAAEWFALGAGLVGGCCRTRPTHIRQVVQAARRLAS